MSLARPELGEHERHLYSNIQISPHEDGGTSDQVCMVTHVYFPFLNFEYKYNLEFNVV